MKIYTRTGDTGHTSLFDGSRVSKGNVRIDLLGQIDELNSFIGLLISEMGENIERDFLYKIQNCLFEAGGEIANPKTNKYYDFQQLVNDLELRMDDYDKQIPELRNFILPGGSKLASICHICRSKTRSVEREFIKFSNLYTNYNSTFGPFLNRLSDYFFVLARKLNKDMDIEDIIWHKDNQ